MAKMGNRDSQRQAAGLAVCCHQRAALRPGNISQLSLDCFGLMDQDPLIKFKDKADYLLKICSFVT